MAPVDKVRGRVVDAHSHIGTMDAWQFYDLKEPVKPTVYEFARAKDYLKHLDSVGVERGLVLPNYGIPVQKHAFSLNSLVIDSVSSSGRLVGGLWVSILSQNKEMTLEALHHGGESGIVALKTTFLLGGNPDPNTWDDETRELAEACFDTAERHDLVFHFHTSAGGSSVERLLGRVLEDQRAHRSATSSSSASCTRTTRNSTAIHGGKAAVRPTRQGRSCSRA